MKTRSLVIAVVTLLAAGVAHAEVNLGGGVSYEGGNTPLSPVLAQVFIQEIYRVAPWEVFGLDLVVATAPVHNDTYANQGMSAGPELFLGADATYRFPALGPAEFALLIGGCGFQDYENRVNGSAAHAGLEVTLNWGSFFVQARGLYRFFSSTGLGGQPIPIGLYSVALLGGYSVSTTPYSSSR